MLALRMIETQDTAKIRNLIKRHGVYVRWLGASRQHRKSCFVRVNESARGLRNEQEGRLLALWQNNRPRHKSRSQTKGG